MSSAASSGSAQASVPVSVPVSDEDEQEWLAFDTPAGFDFHDRIATRTRLAHGADGPASAVAALDLSSDEDEFGSAEDVTTTAPDHAPCKRQRPSNSVTPAADSTVATPADTVLARTRANSRSSVSIEPATDSDLDASWTSENSEEWRTRQRELSLACLGLEEGNSSAPDSGRRLSMPAKMLLPALSASQVSSTSLSVPSPPPSASNSISNSVPVPFARRPRGHQHSLSASLMMPPLTESGTVPIRPAPLSSRQHSQPTTHSHAGVGRNLSLDTSARELGLSVFHFERLALPLLRSEVSDYAKKIVLRIDRVLTALQTDTVRRLEMVKDGMRRNQEATSDAELRLNFAQSMALVQRQIDAVIAGCGNKADTVSAAASPLNSPASGSPAASACASPAPSPIPATSVKRVSLNQYALASQQPSLLPPAKWPQSNQAPSPTAVAGATEQRAAAPVPFYWPRSLAETYYKLLRFREAMLSIYIGFSESGAGPQSSPAAAVLSRRASGTLPPASHDSTPIGSPLTATPSRLSLNSPSSQQRTSVPQPYPKLVALPSTRSNRDGLQLLARIVSGLSLLVTFESGSVQDASKLVLAFQRMSNTFLEKHNLEDPQWALQTS